MAGETTTGDRVRAGVSEAIDGGQQVIALFSVVDSTDTCANTVSGGSFSRHVFSE